MIWWLWIALGIVLAAIELATPGLFLVFFALGALVVGALAALELVTAAWLQWLLFPVIAVVSMRLFRRPLMGRLQQNESAESVDSLVGELATPSTEIPPGGHGRAELRGAMWSARNVAAVPLAMGQRCRVVDVHGLMIDIRPE